MSDILTYREENGYTLIPLNLEPDGSVFVIFRNAKPERHITTIVKDGKSFFPDNQLEIKDFPCLDILMKSGKKSISVYDQGNYLLTWSDSKKEMIRVRESNPVTELTGAWDVYFDPKWGGPNHFVMNKLKSWIKMDEPGIKYYSGTAVYSKNFQLTANEKKGRQVILDLGNVQEMASVKINGQQLQVIWSAPFRFDITSFVRTGNNHLEVEIVNLWPNRLIGDAGLPADKRLTKTNINKFNGPDKEKYLRESGLLGPVKISFVQKFIHK